MSQELTDETENPQAQDETYYSKFIEIAKNILIQAVFMYFVYSYFLKPAKNSKSETKSVGNIIPNIFKNEELMSYFIFTSESSNPNSDIDSTLIFSYEQLHYNNWNDGPSNNGSIAFNYSFSPSSSLLNNGSLYLVACISKNHAFPTFSKTLGYCSNSYCCSTSELTKLKKKSKSSKKNLISGLQTNNNTEDIIINHWHSDITVNTIFDNTVWNSGGIPPPLNTFYNFNSNQTAYFPPLYINNYWNLHEDYRPITTENRTLFLNVILSPLSLFKWQMYIGQSGASPYNFMASKSSDEEKDVLKRTLLETNIYVLALTIFVTILHSVFEFLAFKNDIQFWRTKSDLSGLSVSTIVLNIFQSLIVFLYVYDNDTNFMVILSCGVGVLIDAWKITKVIDISLDRTRNIGPFPMIIFRDKSTYVESNTKKYDRMALKYLSWALFPIFIGYSVYSLIYYEHKGWYSFILSILYGFLLMFGFIMMTPQLFINYKLKSVAHLPWRMLTYKALNTFIDDIFAFVIKMPMLYRIGCLRDDVIFFIYLYQKWIYPIDKKRVNEFGISGEEQSSKIADNSIKQKGE